MNSNKRQFCTYCIRITLDERREWERAAAELAYSQGKPISLAKWVRIICNAEVEDLAYDEIESEGFKL